MGDTSIQWTDKSWNCIRGCSRISPGCGGPGKKGGCYAEKNAARFSGPGAAFEGYAHYVNGEARWTGKMGLIADKLCEPMHWRKPRRIFVNSMSDLFHENLPDAAIDKVFAVMALCPQHTFQVLTKRAERMREYVSGLDKRRDLLDCDSGLDFVTWPLPNVWFGVSVEDQTRADERIPLLLQTPAAKRFISAEPLLGSVDLTEIDFQTADGLRVINALVGHEENGVDMSRNPGSKVGACVGWTPPLDWVICGGESGPGAREFNVQWARDIVDQCKAAGVACFVKQMGRNVIDDGLIAAGDAPSVRFSDKKGGDMSEWPPDLRVREFPACGRQSKGQRYDQAR